MINPNIFKKVKHQYNYSFWLIKSSKDTAKKYALLINNDVIRMVKIDFDIRENPEIKIIKEIFSLSTEDDVRELLKEFNKLEFVLKRFYDFLDKLTSGEYEFSGNKDRNEEEKFYFFLLLIYEFINNREFKYNMPMWFKESFLVKAILLKVKYKFLIDFLNNFADSKNTDDFYEGNEEIYKNILRWFNFCLDNWRFNLNYPPILENFPEKEVRELYEKNSPILKVIYKKYREEFDILKKKTLNFFLKRYDLAGVLEVLIIFNFCLIDFKTKIKKFFAYLLPFYWSLILILIPSLSIFSEGNIKSVLLFSLFSTMFLIYVIFFFMTYKIFFPRALFGSTVAWAVLSSVNEIKEFPYWFCNEVAKFQSLIGIEDLSCKVEVTLVFIFLFIFMVLVYIISEMENFITDLSLSNKIKRATLLLIFIYLITFIIGGFFQYKLLLSTNLLNILKYYYLTSIATFISIAAQIMWEDKPITEV